MALLWIATLALTAPAEVVCSMQTESSQEDEGREETPGIVGIPDSNRRCHRTVTFMG
jgi:hypothetical protein